jgi:hypothetical protein
VLVIDRYMRIQVWNHRAEDLWGSDPTRSPGSIS